MHSRRLRKGPFSPDRDSGCGAMMWSRFKQGGVMNQMSPDRRDCNDLLDTVIQSLFGLGLRLQNALYHVESEPAMVREEIDASLEGMNLLIRRIRSEWPGLVCTAED